MVHYYYPSSGQAPCHSFVRGNLFLLSQLPGEHTGHKAASRHGEPTWNAYYSSIHHQCWYSLYLPTEGWRAESTPGQVESRSGYWTQNLSWEGLLFYQLSYLGQYVYTYIWSYMYIWHVSGSGKVHQGWVTTGPDFWKSMSAM